MKNFLKDGYKNKIIIKDEDVNQLNATKDFLSQLEKDFLIFKDFYRLCEDEYNSWKSKIPKNRRKTIFIPEVLTKQSAMTIIDAKWGSGKTHFVENVLRNMETENVTSYFEHGILVDGWKLSLSNDVVAELFSEIVYSILELNSDGDARNAIESIIRWIYDMSKPPWTKKGIIKKVNKIEVNRSDYELALESIKDKIKPTIIFIDNLERVGRDSWDIVKAASKLLVIPNIVIVLPINLSKMHKVYEEDESEGEGQVEISIEKYLDIKYFEFNQDYIGLLRDLNLHDLAATKINDWLKIPKDGNVLSIREAKHRIEGLNLDKLDDVYEILGIFNGRIWDNDPKFNEWVNLNVNDLYKEFAKAKEYTLKSILDPVRSIGRETLLIEEVFGNFFNRIITAGGYEKNILVLGETINSYIGEIDLWEKNAEKYNNNLSDFIDKNKIKKTELETSINQLTDEHTILVKERRQLQKDIDNLGETLKYDGSKKEKAIEKEIKSSSEKFGLMYNRLNEIQRDIKERKEELVIVNQKLINLKPLSPTIIKMIPKVVENIFECKSTIDNLNKVIEGFVSKRIADQFVNIYNSNPDIPLTEIHAKFLVNSRSNNFIANTPESRRATIRGS